MMIDAEIEKVRNSQLRSLLHLRLRIDTYTSQSNLDFPRAFVVKIFSVETSQAESRTVSLLSSWKTLARAVRLSLYDRESHLREKRTEAAGFVSTPPYRSCG